MELRRGISRKGEGGLLLLLIFAEKKFDGRGLELERKCYIMMYGFRKCYTMKGFGGSLRASCAENIVLEIHSNTRRNRDWRVCFMFL